MGILTEVVVIFVFVILGASLPFDSLRDQAAPAIVTVAALIVIARPIVVLVCLGLDRRAAWTRNELIFIAWTRETGVVPAALAALLVAKGSAIGEQLTTTVAVAIIATLVLQSTTKGWLARRLSLVEQPGLGLAPRVGRISSTDKGCSRQGGGHLSRIARTGTA